MKVKDKCAGMHLLSFPSSSMANTPGGASTNAPMHQCTNAPIHCTVGGRIKGSAKVQNKDGRLLGITASPSTPHQPYENALDFHSKHRANSSAYSHLCFFPYSFRACRSCLCSGLWKRGDLVLKLGFLFSACIHTLHIWQLS